MIAIQSQPVATQVFAGNTLTLTVVASGSGELRYFWKKDEQDVGMDSPIFTKENFQNIDSGLYKCIIQEIESGSTLETDTVRVEEYYDYYDMYDILDNRALPNRRGFGVRSFSDTQAPRYCGRPMRRGSVRALHINDDYVLETMERRPGLQIFHSFMTRATKTVENPSRLRIDKATSTDTWLGVFAN